MGALAGRAKFDGGELSLMEAMGREGLNLTYNMLRITCRVFCCYQVGKSLRPSRCPFPEFPGRGDALRPCGLG